MYNNSRCKSQTQTNLSILRARNLYFGSTPLDSAIKTAVIYVVERRKKQQLHVRALICMTERCRTRDCAIMAATLASFSHATDPENCLD
jgi:hypothetical protein